MLFLTEIYQWHGRPIKQRHRTKSDRSCDMSSYWWPLVTPPFIGWSVCVRGGGGSSDSVYRVIWQGVSSANTGWPARLIRLIGVPHTWSLCVSSRWPLSTVRGQHASAPDRPIGHSTVPLVLEQRQRRWPNTDGTMAIPLSPSPFTPIMY